MSYLFWPSILSRYALTISICMSIISNITTMYKTILNDLLLIVDTKS